ncbi:MAG: phosphoenolpyruvate carboxylase [Nanoarchaeota archaeon]
MHISRIMSTQHPDNVSIPFFSEKAVMDGEDEVQEAFYCFSHLGIGEQLWDAEGKEVDNFVVKKLLARHEDFFRRKKLGKDIFLTLRVPNPDVEKSEGKILLETLHSIPRNFDLAHAFLNEELPPIFEVVLPMCSSELPLLRTKSYYHKMIQSQHEKLLDDDIPLSSWVGELKPEDIRLTPLFETKEAILDAENAVERYVKAAQVTDLQRVWFARSDPALNYGSLAAVILAKIAMQRMARLEEKLSLPILPIIGVGSAPFRGNFKPEQALGLLKGYPSAQTFTVQSAFKYDHPVDQVREAIEQVNETKRKGPMAIDEAYALEAFAKIEAEYQSCIRLLADRISQVSPLIPPRRRRKLHIGLFGYSRETGGIKLPRAITFCAALYSWGLPPELLGLSWMKQQDLEKVRAFYPSVDRDMADALRFFNEENLTYFPAEIQKRVLAAAKLFPSEVDRAHGQVTSRIAKSLGQHDNQAVHDGIVEAARIRRFLG